MDARFQQLCRVLVRISDVLADCFPCDFMSQRLVQPGEEFALCCRLASWPRALWQIFKSVRIVFSKVIGEKDRILLYSLKACSIAWFISSKTVQLCGANIYEIAFYALVPTGPRVRR